MHIANLHHAPPASVEAVMTRAILLLHTDRLDELNREVQRDIRRHALTRARLEATIERLIGALDADDGDPDLEPDLAGSEPHHADREGWGGIDEDFETVNEDGDELDHGEENYN